MKIRMALMLALFGVIGFTPAAVPAADYVLPFVATPNAPDGAEGVMRIRVEDGKSTVHLRVRGLHPDTLYTICRASASTTSGWRTTWTT